MNDTMTVDAVKAAALEKASIEAILTGDRTAAKEAAAAARAYLWGHGVAADKKAVYDGAAKEQAVKATMARKEGLTAAGLKLALESKAAKRRGSALRRAAASIGL